MSLWMTKTSVLIIIFLKASVLRAAPRYVCGVGGKWRGTGAHDGYGWFEEHIHGGETCSNFCETKAHAKCVGVCPSTQGFNDASVSICNCTTGL